MHNLVKIVELIKNLLIYMLLYSKIHKRKSEKIVQTTFTNFFPELAKDINTKRYMDFKKIFSVNNSYLVQISNFI
jgi:hypothetical protein